MFDDIKEYIVKANRVAIFTHVNPDGDALGSAYALELALKGMGKRAQVFLEGGCSSRLRRMVRYRGKRNLVIKDCDLKIAIDCADINRLGYYKKYFEGDLVNTIAIDHHVTHVPYAFAYAVDGCAASCGEVVYCILKDMGLEITLNIAHNLYIAIASDTGGFKYPSVSGDTYRIAAELIDLGVDFARICKEIYDTVSLEYLNLTKIAIDKIKLYCNGRVAIMALTDEDFKTAGVSESEADAIVNLPRGIEGVEVGVYIREREKAQGEKKYKVSLRSNKHVDVSQIAVRYGGGGHICASGYTVQGDIEKICNELAVDFEQVFDCSAAAQV